MINYKLTRRSGGFTLIELLVSMVLAALVITPLIGFMINIIDTDRKEQAKATSEQELQVSLDYIAQDLQQAVYIYDGEGVAAIQEQLPHYNDATKVPVLVFWKRQVIKDAIRYDGQLCTTNDVTSEDCDDSFVYSLVAYYLIKDNGDNDATWSGAAQIGRFQIKDGVQDPNYPVDKYGNPQYIKDYEPDRGFKLFNLDAQANTLKAKMNQWQKERADYQETTKVLVDFIDQSTSGVPSAVDCSSTLGLDSSVNDDTLRVPPISVDTLNTNSFYACVDSSRTLVQVYIRGNAFARLSNDQIASNATYSSSRSVYFPTVTVRLEGRGFLNGE